MQEQSGECTLVLMMEIHGLKFQLNLPVTSIRDLEVKDNDLVVATHGRSFWIIDDLTPLHQLNE